MDNLQTHTTKGKFPHGKEPDPFKDEAADKTQKVNREKRKIPDSDDLDAYVEMALRYWEPPFPYDCIPQPMYVKLDERASKNLRESFLVGRSQSPLREIITPCDKLMDKALASFDLLECLRKGKSKQY